MINGLGANDVLLGGSGSDVANGGPRLADSGNAETESNCEVDP